MKHSEQELREGARHLECTTYGVLHERHLERYISPQHWDSLTNGPVRGASSPGARPLLPHVCLATPLVQVIHSAQGSDTSQGDMTIPRAGLCGNETLISLPE